MYKYSVEQFRDDDSVKQFRGDDDGHRHVEEETNK